MSSDAFSLFDLAPGRLVAGRFHVVRAHRHSGISTAFEAREEPDGAPCELIVFSGALFEGPAQAEEYRRSWEPWMRLKSPHVQTIREALTPSPTTLVLVCDPPPGDSLRAWLKEHGRMELAPALALGDQLLEAVEEIHEVGLVHGDIKPQTTYVEGPPRAEPHTTLVDGGITGGLWSAKHLGERTALIGTPLYAPVEQFGGDAPDVRSDVYNVATLLFEVLTGVLPWPGKSLLEVFQAKLDRAAPSMRRRAPEVEVPEAVERAVVKGLMADRNERYASAAEFRQALREL
jgi:eukaryotic-like serine/threonine-protein kinase